MDLTQTVKAEHDKLTGEIEKLEADLAKKKAEIKPIAAYLVAQGVIEKKKRGRKKAAEA